MATYHILNGDCLAKQLLLTKINKNFIVCREALIEGDVYAQGSTDFWNTRAKFLAESYHVPTDEYFSKTVSEFEKIIALPDHSQVCLWFENDLFCQVNLWFVLSILPTNPTLKIYRVFPFVKNVNNIWKGFGISNSQQLEQSYFSKVQLSSENINLGIKLWSAYQNGDLIKLKELSKTESYCFKYLEEVCQAHIERFPSEKTLGRPERIVKEIIDAGTKGFQAVFSEFSKREGIYGFGDLQLKSIYDRQMLRNNKG